MNGHFGLQAVFERFLPSYQSQRSLSPAQQKACWHIEQCRTEALGGLQQHCNQCGFEQTQYHSCRDRYCPQCQGQAQHTWSQNQLQSVLPVTYYHLVFTLPHTLNGWVELHPATAITCFRCEHCHVLIGGEWSVICGRVCNAVSYTELRGPPKSIGNSTTS